MAPSKIVVIMPAYNAARTLERTYREIPSGVVDECIVVDDLSADSTVEVARKLGLRVFLHRENQGYGGNQKTCYAEALKDGADLIVMLHPDYQYDPKKIPELVVPILEDRADIVLGSRMAYADAGGMPGYKKIANRFLTWCENKVFGLKLSEYHTGFRAFRRSTLEKLPFLLNSNDFVFDQEIIAQAIWFGARFEEISVPHRYFPEASTINLGRSIRYGLGILWLLALFILNRAGILRSRQFRPLQHDYREVLADAEITNMSGTDLVSPGSTDIPAKLSAPKRGLLVRWMQAHRVELLLFLLLWTTYAYFYQSTQQNEAARFDQTRAIVQDRTLAIDKYRWNSADVIRYSKNGVDRIYPNKAPGTTFLGVVPFLISSLSLKLFTAIGLPEWIYWHLVAYLTITFTISLLSALAAVAMYGILKRMTLDVGFSALAVLAIWLGTMAFPFSTLFFSHQQAAAQLAIAFYLLFRVGWDKSGSERRLGAFLCAGGLLMGFTVTTEYPTVLLVGVLSIYAFWVISRLQATRMLRARLAGAFALGMAVGGGTLILYNLAAFGKLIYFPYEAYVTPGSPFPVYSRGFLGLHWAGLRQFFHALAAITIYPPIGILYVRVERWWIYACNPVLWLALPGLAIMLGRRNLRVEGLMVAAMILVYIFFITNYGNSIYDWAGASYLGPRHIIPLLPFLALPLYYGARKLRFVFYPLLAISVFYMLLATAVEPRVPYPFENPERDSFVPDYLRGNLAQNTDAMFDSEHHKLTRDSTAFNFGKLARLPGRYQLAPLMLWWLVAGSALLFAAARDHGSSAEELGADPVDNRQQDHPAPPRAPPGATYSPRVALFALFIFVFAIALAPPIYHAARSLKSAKEGLLGKYYRSVNWTGEPAEVQVDPSIDFDWSNTVPLPAPFSVEWQGSIWIDKPGDYDFALIADDGALLEIDGHLVVDASKVLLQKITGTIHLTPGPHAIRVRYFNIILGGSVRLFWTPPGGSEQIVPSDVLRPSAVR